MWTYATYDELYHHGIKGQKWGQRRFQYEDGSLTPDGRIRYGISNVKNRASAAGKAIKNRVSATGKTVKERVSNKWNGLSDKQKKAIKIGAAVAGTALAAYAGYKIADGIITKNGIKTANSMIHRGKLTSDYLLSSAKDDAKWIRDLNQEIGDNSLLAKADMNSTRSKEGIDAIRNARNAVASRTRTRDYVAENSHRYGSFIGNDGRLHNASSRAYINGSYDYVNPNADKQREIRTKEELRNFARGYYQETGRKLKGYRR